jgi:hypothetical protein
MHKSFPLFVLFIHRPHMVHALLTYLFPIWQTFSNSKSRGLVRRGKATGSQGNQTPFTWGLEPIYGIKRDKAMILEWAQVVCLDRPGLGDDPSSVNYFLNYLLISYWIYKFLSAQYQMFWNLQNSFEEGCACSFFCSILIPFFYWLLYFPDY